MGSLHEKAPLRGLAFEGRRADLFLMDQVPMTFSVAGGVMLAAFFLVVFNWGVRFATKGRPRLGVCMILFALFYGSAIVIGSIG
jgi:hypothetical protein